MQMLSCHFLIKQFQMGGTICLWHLYPYIYWYFLISSYYLTVSNGHSLTAMKTCSCHFLVKQFQMGGTICLWYLHVFSAVVFPDIFLLFDCFKWGLIDCIEKRRGHSELWQFQLGGPSAFGVYMFSLCAGISLFDCFEWVLIDCIEKCRGHSELWQFQLGGPSAFGVYMFSLCAGISLFDCFEWVLIDCIVKCRGHSELWQFHWGGPSAFGVYMFWYFLI